MDKKNEQENPQEIEITVNKIPYSLTIGAHPNQVSPSDTLAKTLRETLGLTGTKVGCDQGSCGACTVIMNDVPVLSCLTLTIECDGRHITTIEGLQDPKTGDLDPLQQSFINHTAFQCGFCTPGMITASRALLDKHSTPNTQDVKETLSGHFCRCISHYHVVDAVLSASKKGE